MNVGNNSKGFLQALHHQIFDQILVQYSYNVLLQQDKSNIYTATEGALVNETITESTQQFGTQAFVNITSSSKVSDLKVKFFI